MFAPNVNAPVAPGDEHTHDDAETTSVDALMAFSMVLNNLEADDRETTLTASLVRQTTLLLLDYRRTLEIVAGLQLTALPRRERERALSAYQDVCQHVTLMTSQLESTLRTLS